MFSDFDRAMMRLALEQAEAARAAGEIPVGAVVTRGDEVVFTARNTREADRDPTGHAEINALRGAAKKLKGEPTWAFSHL